MEEIIRKMASFLGVYEDIKLYKNIISQTYMRYFKNSNKNKEDYIKKQFRKNLGYDIDFSKVPQTFNEKIQFRKIYDDNPLYSICSDKYRVREYVKEKIGEKYLIPLFLVTEKLTKEQWDKLPNQFVAKANHNSGPVQIVKDKNKVDKKKIIKELNNQLKLDYGISSLEGYYSDIPRRIIVEKLLDENGNIPKDYKLHCFNTEKDTKIFLQIDEDRFIDHKRSFFDENLNRLDLKITSEFAFGKSNIKDDISSEQWNLMKKLAKKLSEDFDYTRVDLYIVNEKIYFGEITFCHGSGFEDFEPIEWDYKFGSYWKQRKLK